MTERRTVLGQGSQRVLFIRREGIEVSCACVVHVSCDQDENTDCMGEPCLPLTP